MADAFFDVFWWLVVGGLGIVLGLWLNNNNVNYGANRLVALPARVVVFAISLLLAAVLVIVLIESLIAALY